MDKKLEEKLAKIPLLNTLVDFGKKIILPGMEGLSLYDLIEIYIIGIVKGTFSARASAISWSFFLSLFPFLLFLLNLIPFIPIEEFDLLFYEFIDSSLPRQSAIFFQNIYNDISSTPRGGLLSTAFVLSLLLMTNGVNAIFSGFSKSYYVTLNRSFIRQYIVALGVSLIVASLLFITIIITLYFSYLLENLKNRGMVQDTVILLELGKYGFFILMIFLMVSTLFYYGTKEGRMQRFFSPGAFLTTFLIIIATYLFGIYLDNFSNYNQLYGSIGAMLILMVYTWLNANLLLLGFELNASLTKLKNK